MIQKLIQSNFYKDRIYNLSLLENIMGKILFRIHDLCRKYPTMSFFTLVNRWKTENNNEKYNIQSKLYHSLNDVVSLLSV